MTHKFRKITLFLLLTTLVAFSACHKRSGPQDELEEIPSWIFAPTLDVAKLSVEVDTTEIRVTAETGAVETYGNPSVYASIHVLSAEQVQQDIEASASGTVTLSGSQRGSAHQVVAGGFSASIPRESGFLVVSVHPTQPSTDSIRVSSYSTSYPSAAVADLETPAAVFTLYRTAEVELPSPSATSPWLDMTSNIVLYHLNDFGMTHMSAIQDSSLNGLDATLHAPNALNYTVAGRLSRGLSFDGSVDNLLSVPLTHFETSGTISIWARLTEASTGIYTIFSSIHHDNGNTGMQIHYDGPWEKFRIQFNDYAQPTQEFDIGTSALGSWNHVAFTWSVSDTRYRVYFNGQRIDIPGPVPWAPNNLDFALGSGWFGDLDEFAYWTRELSEVEITNIYQRQK
ncbi:MAG: LamG domain-containing protein [Bdellovibrionaceae bacterium]|nr:LamG domain-containing protein [Bdellovibrionales bacterium]MCB9255039.1 LamG domain-containing protein [Pseudobdellovibrionaceae bacterium]